MRALRRLLAAINSIVPSARAAAAKADPVGNPVTASATTVVPLVVQPAVVPPSVVQTCGATVKTALAVNPLGVPVR